MQTLPNILSMLMLIKVLIGLSVNAEDSCPASEIIFPCTCDVVNEAASIDCSSAKTEDQIESIFKTTFFPLSQFSRFTFTNNHEIKSFNGNLFRNVSFGGIILGNSVLEYVAPSVFQSSFNTLKFWYVYDNPKMSVEGFPFESMEDYKSLNSLEISNCSLRKMPLISSQSLSKLILTRDGIPSILKEAFTFLPNLRSVIFVQNEVTTLHAGTFDSLPNLEFINLVYNNLVGIAKGAFTNLERLSELRLYGNHIITIDSGMIQNCPNLREVMVYQNSLTRLHIDGEPFNGTTFNFGKNQISSVNEGSFSGLRNGHLRLSFNNVRTLDEGWLKPILDGNNSVELDYNPLICGCDILWLFEQGYLDYNDDDIFPISGKCSDGSNLATLEQEFLDWLINKCKLMKITPLQNSEDI